MVLFVADIRHHLVHQGSERMYTRQKGDWKIHIAPSIQQTKYFILNLVSLQLVIQLVIQSIKGIPRIFFIDTNAHPLDGNAFGTCGQDGTVRLFDIRACNQLACYSGVPSENEMESFTKLDFSGSGRLIFAGHSDGNVYAYDVLSDRTGPAFALQGAHEKAISSIGVSPRGNALCTASWDGVLKVWA